jgi:phosphoglycerate dehydrogenase-like enzyme
MKILFAAHPDAWGGIFHLLRAEVPEHQFTATGRFAVDDLAGVDVLIPTMTQVTDEVLATSDRLRLIQQCGAGLEGVDIEAARKRNIWVANVPTASSGNADSVAELGIYQMIGLARDFRGMARSLREGRVGQPTGRALSGKTAGIVGLGGIGQALIRRLRAFDTHLIGIKRTHPEEARARLDLEWVGGPGDLKLLLSRSHFVVLCLPLTPESRHVMNPDTLSAMRRDAFLINLSRGGLVDRAALETALSTGAIAGAGLDVFWEEPADPGDPVFRYNVLATPHIAGSTDISRQGILLGITENIHRLEENLVPLHNAW